MNDLSKFEKILDYELSKLKDKLMRKNSDYGSSIISGDEEIWLLYDISARLKEKVMRLRNILKKQIKTGEAPNFESVEETFDDINGYSFLAKILINKDN